MDGQPRKNRLSVRGIAWLLLLLAMMPNWASTAYSEQSSLVVRLVPPTNVLEVGESTRISVRVDGATNVYGVELHLSFDASKIQILDADLTEPGVQLVPGDFLPSNQGFLLANEADNETGTLIYALTLLAPSEPISGAGTLVEFDLMTIAQGEITLMPDPVILASPGGDSLPVLVEYGQIMISGSQVTAVPTGQPTLTSEPTVGPTAETVKTATPTPTVQPISETTASATPINQSTSETLASATPAYQPTPDPSMPVSSADDQNPLTTVLDTPTPFDSGVVPTATETLAEAVMPEEFPTAISQDEVAPTDRNIQTLPIETRALSPTEPPITSNVTTREAVAIIGQNSDAPEPLLTIIPSEPATEPSQQTTVMVALFGIGSIVLLLAAGMLLVQIMTRKSGEDNDVN